MTSQDRRELLPLTLAIPVFNGARFLDETLASLNVNGPEVRWHLQDGGSKDKTVEIARSLAREGDTIVSETDQGQTDALNRAFPKMGGEIIGFINADDLLMPDTVQRVLDVFAQRSDIDIVYGDVEWIDEHGAVTGLHRGQISTLAEALDLYGVWWQQRQWVQPEVFFRRSLWERVGPFDTRYQLAFDYDFWVRCFLAGARVKRIPHVLARFRLHSAQKSSAAAQAADELRDIVDRHLATRPEIGLLTRRRIAAELSYDRFQLGQSPAGPGASFFRALLHRPDWLLARPVRERLKAVFQRRLQSST